MPARVAWIALSLAYAFPATVPRATSGSISMPWPSCLGKRLRKWRLFRAARLIAQGNANGGVEWAFPRALSKLTIFSSLAISRGAGAGIGELFRHVKPGLIQRIPLSANIAADDHPGVVAGDFPGDWVSRRAHPQQVEIAGEFQRGLFPVRNKDRANDQDIWAGRWPGGRIGQRKDLPLCAALMPRPEFRAKQ